MRASERVYRRLRRDVLDGVLAPGDVLAEVEQSKRLGVSRTPVREAFARLLGDGLASPLAGRGLVVSALSARSVEQLYEVRSALEEQAVRLAALRRDPAVFTRLAEEFARAPRLLEEPGEDALDRYYALTEEFDAALDEAVDNPHLVQALTAVRTHLARVRRLARHDPARLRRAAAEHQLVAEAVAAGDAVLAVHAVGVHLHRSRARFVEAVARQEAGAPPAPHAPPVEPAPPPEPLGRPQEVPA
ncbi:GntR family transcriptional regulator [Kineococcus terrestris]|uniref:GntR family transcriptional regulator n=1 Tax=Kineococcus terrestris TaxID=2044856 RepID=UPI0034DB506D